MELSRRNALAAGALLASAALAGCGAASRRSTAPDSSSAASGQATATSGGSGGASTAAGPSSPTPATSAPTSTAASGPARVVSNGPRTGSAVALTFHGAGDPAIARDILAVFAAHRARMTVLAVGQWITANPDVARQIVAGGHELGNHTYQHLDINSLSPAQARDEIVRCRNALITAVGSPGAHFRQSQSQTPSSTVRELAGQAGYPVCLSYDVDSLDYTDPGASVVRSRVAAARAGSVVSLHLGHADTVTAMPHILTDLAGRGLRAVTAAELLA